MSGLTDVQHASQVALDLVSKNLVVTPRPGPLSVLCSEFSVAESMVSAMHGLAPDNEISYEAQHKVAGIIEGICQCTMKNNVHGNTLDSSYYDMKIDELSDMIATGVTATVSKARTVCIPLINEVQDRVLKVVNEYSDNLITNIAIDEVGIGQILERDDVYDYFEEYKAVKTNIDRITGAKSLPHKPVEEMLNYIDSGDDDINQLMLGFATANQESMAILFDAVFTQENGAQANLNPIEVYRMAKDLFADEELAHAMMVIHYVAVGLKDDIPDGVNSSLAVYEASIETISRVFGAYAFNILKAYRDTMENKDLFPYGLPKVDNRNFRVNSRISIRVNKDVYANFLSEGGTPEVIYGSMVSDRTDSFTQLIARKDEFETAYYKFVANNRATATSDRLALYRATINDIFYALADDETYSSQIRQDKDVFIRMHDHLKRLGADDISNPESFYKYLRRMICHTIYPDDPMIESLISNIDNYEADDNLSPSDIAGMVAVEIIVDWLTKQVVVTRE